MMTLVATAAVGTGHQDAVVAAIAEQRVGLRRCRDGADYRVVDDQVEVVVAAQRVAEVRAGEIFDAAQRIDAFAAGVLRDAHDAQVDVHARRRVDVGGRVEPLAADQRVVAERRPTSVSLPNQPSRTSSPALPTSVSSVPLPRTTSLPEPPRKMTRSMLVNDPSATPPMVIALLPARLARSNAIPPVWSV